MPEPPGMRMSETRTWGSSVVSAAITSRPLLKLRTASSSRASAFSSTKRIDWSSSTIQMGFMGSLSDAILPSGGSPGRIRRYRSAQRNQYLEDGLAWFALAYHGALVLLNEGSRQRQTQ